MTTRVSIDDLVSDYKAATKELADLSKKQQAVATEKSALYHLICARGGEHLIAGGGVAFVPVRTRVRPPAEKQLELAGSQYEIIKLSLPQGNFSANEVMELVKEKIPGITRKAVGFNLARLTKDEFIHVITPGRGRREGIYKRA
jgi:hypothetical protein